MHTSTCTPSSSACCACRPQPHATCRARWPRPQLPASLPPPPDKQTRFTPPSLWPSARLAPVPWGTTTAGLHHRPPRPHHHHRRLRPQVVHLLAPNLSVSAVAAAFLSGESLRAVLPAPNSVRLDILPLSLWGRTLSQAAGVDPLKLGLAAGTPAPAFGQQGFLVDPVALADLYEARMTLDLSELIVSTPFRDSIDCGWRGTGGRAGAGFGRAEARAEGRVVVAGVWCDRREHLCHV